MSYSECSAARICTVRGTLAFEIAAHAQMGRMTLADGRCVSISLPPDRIRDLRERGPAVTTVTGRVYGDPSVDEEIGYLEIRGRRIGLGLCDDFFVFVE